jgi:septal ring factor EnvC (AmiA/AmiB activator)
MSWLRPVALTLFLAVLWLPITSPAAEDIDRIARARASLATASTALQHARDGETRLAALGRAATAYETVLSALRAGLRRMAAAEQAMTARIDSEVTQLRHILAALQSLSATPAPALLATRGGPLEATRAAMLMAAITPELDRRATAFGQELQTLQSLRGRQQSARAEARDALASLQDLRAQTMRALGRRDRAGLVARSELRRQARAAAARARDLDALATALRDAAVEPEAKFGPAPLPVAGEIVAKFGEPDPWGRPGKGWSIEAPAFAQVTAPWDATLRYAGPLIDYGQVVVLEPEAGYLVVIAGLANINRSAGEAVLAGEILGDLGGQIPNGDEILLEETTGTVQTGRETLYLEIRRSGKPLDPAEWFDTTGSEAIR